MLRISTNKSRWTYQVVAHVYCLLELGEERLSIYINQGGEYFENPNAVAPCLKLYDLREVRATKKRRWTWWHYDRSSTTPPCFSIRDFPPLLPQLPQTYFLIIMLVKHLRRRQVEILLRDMHPPLPQRIHARLRAHALQLRPTAPVHLLCDLRQIDPPRQIHRPRMNPQDIRSRLHGRRWELDLPIDTPRTQERRVEDIETVRRHDDFYVFGRFEAVELVEQFQHRALHFAVPAGTAFHARGADAVDFVHEDDAGGVFTRHDEELSHHAAAFADVFLHELRAGDADEFAVCVVGHRSCE